jgi:hypothetical protein
MKKIKSRIIIPYLVAFAGMPLWYKYGWWAYLCYIALMFVIIELFVEK